MKTTQINTTCPKGMKLKFLLRGHKSQRAISSFTNNYSLTLDSHLPAGVGSVGRHATVTATAADKMHPPIRNRRRIRAYGP